MPRTTINFQCSPALRAALQAAADRSGVSLSKQVRRTLEVVYGVEAEKPVCWLPPLLRPSEGDQAQEETAGDSPAVQSV